MFVCLFPDRPTYLMMALTLHETNPGHHLQVKARKEVVIYRSSHTKKLSFTGQVTIRSCHLQVKSL